MQKVFYFMFMCLLCGVSFAGPMEKDDSGVGLNNNWEIIEIKSVAGEYEHDTAIPPDPVYEVLHVHHVPLTIPLYTSIIVHDKHQTQQQTKLQDTNAIQPTYKPNGRDPNDKSCNAPNGGGFNRFFSEVYEQLPKHQIIKIIRNGYKHDSQVRAFRKILFSKAVLDKLNVIGHSPEFEKLTDYACKRLYMDINSYLKVVRLLIAAKQEEFVSDVSHEQQQSSSDELELQEFNGRPGVRGLIQDIYDILPREQLHQLYNRLRNSDYYLAYGIRNVKATEFRHLLGNLRFVPEYRELRDMLIDAGLPLNDFNKLMAAALGWEGEVPQEVFTA